MAQHLSETVTFSLKVYSVETIKKAAYRLSDIMSVDILPSADEIQCTLHINPDLTGEQAQRAVAAFRNEVLDQDLRTVVANETDAIRNAILAYALSKTGLQSGE